MTTSLDALQRWMQAAIAEGEGEEAAAEHLLPSSRLSPAGRLAIYQRGYQARLLRCLREELPLVRAALDDEVFDLFALEYLAKHPPASYTLDELDRRFVDFLRAERPAIDGAHEWWTDLLIDLARLDRVTRDVFDGRVPSCVETFGFELIPFASAVRRGEARPPLPVARSQTLLIYRRAFVVHYRAQHEPER